MSDSIEIEFGTPEVKIDHSVLAQELLEESTDGITDIVNEAIDHYMRYEFDVSDMVSDYVNETINEAIDSLLSDVSPGSLCGVGTSFASAIETILVHHLDMKDIIINNHAIESDGGLTKLVQDAMKKEMVVNVSFVDKQPAEVVEVVQETSNSATDLIPGPVDEINTRSENV